MPPELPKYVIVITTCPDDAQATQLTTALIDQKLAACVQASHITSTYRWQGSVETSKEVRLLIKAKYPDYAAIQTLIESTLSYETPEIIVIPIIAGSETYLDWIDAQTR